MAINAATLEQTGTYLERRVRRWDRRLRFVQSALWLPRGLMAGLVAALGIALASRLRVWLLPHEAALLCALAISLGGVAALIGVWARPRPVPRLARHFDLRFGLKERVSTALELADGRIPSVEVMITHQLDDAMRAAAGVNAAVWLPVRVRLRELAILAGLAGLLAYLLLAPNPRADELRARQALDQALAAQVEALDATIQDIQQDPQLTEAEKDALTQPLKEARDTLNQPGVTQPEAVAALAEAGQSLEELSGGMLPEQRQTYEQAAQSLDGSTLTQPMADALRTPDLQSAGQAVQKLADDVSQGDLSEAEREDLANRLDDAADNLEASNPALAEQMRAAAEALRQGDVGAAQEALSEAAQALQEQQQQLDQSPLADQANSAQQQAAQSQQQLAQSGQMQDSEQASQAPGQQSGQQPGMQGEQGQQPAQEGESGAQGQPGDQSSGGEGQQAQPSGDTADQSGGEGQQAQGEGQAQDGAQSAGQGDGGSQQGAAEPGEGSSQSQDAAASAGQGEGGAGNDTTSGVQQDAAPQSGGSSGDGNGAPGEYESAYDPSTIGGQSNDTIDVGGQVTDPNAVPVQEGELGPNPSGESSLSYTGVYGDYQGAVSDALGSPRIPLGQRDVIHDYFSALEP